MGNIGCCEQRLSGTAMNSSVLAVTNDVWPLRLAKEGWQRWQVRRLVGGLLLHESS